MWLPWRGIPNQINIDSTPRLRLMIPEYEEDNEVLFLATDLGTYRPKVAVQMLQGLNGGDNSQEVINSTEAVVESDQDFDQMDDGMFENFRRFVYMNIKQGIELGNLACVEDLLLPNWCRIHNAFHYEF